MPQSVQTTVPLLTVLETGGQGQGPHLARTSCFCHRGRGPAGSGDEKDMGLPIWNHRRTVVITRSTQCLDRVKDACRGSSQQLLPDSAVREGVLGGEPPVRF